MTTASKVDEFTKAVRPLLADGNEFAVTSWLRVATADDPDAEVDAVISDVIAVVARMWQVVGPVVEAWQTRFER